MRFKFATPPRSGNRFTLISDGREYFGRMLQAIDSSEHDVLAEFYLVESGAVADAFIAALLQAASRGVRVRLIFDDFGARGLNDSDRARLLAGGVRLAFYNRLRQAPLARVLMRDHRKLLLVDGRIGYTGGAGLTDAFSPEARPDSYWLDCMVEMTGPILRDWHGLFAATWHRCTRTNLDVQPRGALPATPGASGRVACSAGPGREDLGYSVIRQVRRARTRVWIVTPYFWPSIRLRRALKRAADRGLDVRLLLAGPLTDAPRMRIVSRFFYARLLAHGVVIHEYQPRFLHCKIALCDEWVSIGSSNLDRWGALWNLDANQEIDSPEFALQTERLLRQICEHSLILRSPREVQHAWSAHLWRRVARIIFGWSTRTVSRLRRRGSRWRMTP